MERRDLGIALGGLVAGFGLVSGLFYYNGGKQVINPLANFGERLTPSAAVSPTPVETTSAGGGAEYLAGRPGASPSPAASLKPGAARSAANSGFTGEVRGATLQVKSNKLTMHKCPGYDCETVTSLPIGTRVILLGESDNSQGEEWCRVRSGNREGWVSRYFLE
jgi:hypothetical protein